MSQTQTKLTDVCQKFYIAFKIFQDSLSSVPLNYLLQHEKSQYSENEGKKTKPKKSQLLHFFTVKKNLDT